MGPGWRGLQRARIPALDALGKGSRRRVNRAKLTDTERGGRSGVDEVGSRVAGSGPGGLSVKEEGSDKEPKWSRVKSGSSHLAYLQAQVLSAAQQYSLQWSFKIRTAAEKR